MFAAAGAMIVEAEEGLIRLAVKNTEEGEEGEAGEITVDFDAKTFFPKAITAAQEGEGTMEVSFSNVVFHEKLEGFGAKAFSFTAPEGMFVMDLTPMIEMQLQAAGGGMGDEEELEF
jgi:outer membrane lipoprotein-sorting protein